MINDIPDKADSIKFISKYFLTFLLRLLVVLNFKQRTFENSSFIKEKPKNISDTTWWSFQKTVQKRLYLKWRLTVQSHEIMQLTNLSEYKF